jgi:putative DNA primase/helicase
MSDRAPLLDAVEVGKTLAIVVEPGQVFEVRILDPRRARGHSPRVILGYFDDPALVPGALAALRLEGAKGIYLTMNPVKPVLLARSHNKFVESKGGDCAGDKDILSRQWLLIDVDPKRPARISASDDEKALSHAKAGAIYSHLKDAGWPEPVAADSGNGHHLIYRINSPASSEIVKGCLEALDHRFSDDAVGVDTTVHNPARIVKLYGTRAEKGGHCPDLGRPHRLSRLLSVPDSIEVVTQEQLEALAVTGKPETPSKAPEPHVNGTGSSWDQAKMEDWINRHLGAFQPGPATPCADGTKWKLNCPFNPDHGDDAGVILYTGGKCGFKCFHNGCSGNDWKALRAKFEPRPERTRKDQRSTSPPSPDNYPANDSGNARRFIDYAGEKIRYIPERDLWIVWNGHHWKPDDDGALYRMAEEHAKELLRKSADIADGDLRMRGGKLALNLGKRAVIENMLALARYNEAVIIHAEKLDSNPWLLGVGNGVVDLKTGKFRAGAPPDYISNKTGCDYVPGATCPQFDAFLDRIMANDAEMIAYLWRIVGYCLTGSTTEQCLFFLYGAGRNGKSTLIEVLAALLGDYGRATAVELITDSQHGREPSQLIAAIQGKRLVWLPEVEESHRVAQSRLKTLTGGDRLCGRNLYEKEFEFDCTAKLLIHGNTRPEIRGTDLGIWRRFRLIPFAVTIPANEVDFDLPKKLITELPGILSRAIESCLEWQRNGMKTPKTVEMATDDYREAEDILGEFLGECTVHSVMAEITKGRLHKAYAAWCDERSQRPLTVRRFGNLIAQRGIKERRTTADRYWQGITLK